jgi:hypothetical protein
MSAKSARARGAGQRARAAIARRFEIFAGFLGRTALFVEYYSASRLVKSAVTLCNHPGVEAMPKGAKKEAKSNKPKLTTKEKQKKKSEKKAKK